MDYQVKLMAIRAVKAWFDKANEPIVLTTGHLDLLLAEIEAAIRGAQVTERCGDCLGQRVKGSTYHCES
jgi:hypothetical protein